MLHLYPNSVIATLQKRFSLTAKELWILAGIHPWYQYSCYELRGEAKKIDFFKDQKEYLVFMETESVLEDLVRRKILEVAMVEVSHQYMHGAYERQEAQYSFTQKFVSFLPPLCPINRPEICIQKL